MPYYNLQYPYDSNEWSYKYKKFDSRISMVNSL